MSFGKLVFQLVISEAVQTILTNSPWNRNPSDIEKVSLITTSK